ncbi:MAG: histidine phosphatase family protein [Burkholderiales bacterium]|nr:histidine phosphatase family protein [Burkholderiales bacterium]
MSLLFLVRHAQASFGTDDYDRLSELGLQQSRWLGEYFAERGVSFTRIVAGTLRRQRQTAQEIAAALGIGEHAIGIDAGLDEYPGDALYAAHTGGADALAQQRADHRDYWRTFRAAMTAWSGGQLAGVPEDWDGFGSRIGEALTRAAEGTRRDDAVLLVSSGGAIGRAVADITGAPASTAIELNLQFRNTGVCELIAGGGALRLLSYNNVPHLDRPQRRHAITFA